LTQLLLPRLRAAATADDPARVINVGSIDGMRVPLQETYAYSSSKAAEHMLSQHLAVRLGGENITVNVISPGLYVTRMTQTILGTEEGRMEMVRHSPVARVGTPSDVAGACIFLASRAGSYVNGAILPVDGGMYLMPG
jgi:NAD(P)-dependent dehydrogenase (short-subunit alcohol dehydrogenase family)